MCPVPVAELLRGVLSEIWLLFRRVHVVIDVLYHYYIILLGVIQTNPHFQGLLLLCYLQKSISLVFSKLLYGFEGFFLDKFRLLSKYFSGKDVIRNTARLIHWALFIKLSNYLLRNFCDSVIKGKYVMTKWIL